MLRRALLKTNDGNHPMLYEMRIYDCLPGRMPALMKRFENHTLKLWDKHGIRQAGFFTSIYGGTNNELTYFLAWESAAERDTKWGAFVADPEWIKARDESERDGPILAKVTNQLLKPTAFSSVK